MIRSLLPTSVAAKATIFLLSCSIVFHILVVTGFIPYEIVWGGRITSKKEMLAFESLSLLINGAMLAVVLIAANYLRIRARPWLIRFLLWAMTILFILNTIGNILSTNTLETIIFTPLTFLLALFCFRLAID